MYIGVQVAGPAGCVIERLPGIDRTPDFGTKEVGIAGTGGRLVGDDGLDIELLIAEAGRSGGRIGLAVSALKKLDLRLFEEGDDGICESVSMVLSRSDGLGLRFVLGVSG